MIRRTVDLEQKTNRCREIKKWRLVVLSASFLFLAICLPVYATQTITKDQWQKLTGDKAFNYRNDSEEIHHPGEYKSIFFQKQLHAFLNFFDHGGGQLLLWIAVTGVLAYIFYKVVLDKDSFLFGRNRKVLSRETRGEQEAENIVTTNWELLLQNATINNDLRLAVRYSYMWLLQLLQRQELIQYRTDKTNYNYYTELQGTEYEKSFKQLSRQYEYAWYGHFTLQDAAYNEYIMLFNNVRKQLDA